jgi:hypothetical protein
VVLTWDRMIFPELEVSEPIHQLNLSHRMRFTLWCWCGNSESARVLLEQVSPSIIWCLYYLSNIMQYAFFLKFCDIFFPKLDMLTLDDITVKFCVVPNWVMLFKKYFVHCRYHACPSTRKTKLKIEKNAAAGSCKIFLTKDKDMNHVKKNICICLILNDFFLKNHLNLCSLCK